MLNKNEELIISKLTSPYSQFETAYTKLKDVNLKFGEITHRLFSARASHVPIFKKWLVVSLHWKDLKNKVFDKRHDHFKRY